MGAAGNAAAFAGAMDLASPFISYGLNAMAASKAHDRQKNMMTRGPTYQMQGYRDAGLNPLLMIAGGGKAPNASAPMAAPAQMGRGGLPAVSTAMQAKKLNSELRNLRLHGDLLDQQRAESITRSLLHASGVTLNTARQRSENLRADAAELSLIPARERRTVDESDWGKRLNRFGRWSELFFSPVSGPIRDAVTAKGLAK